MITLYKIYTNFKYYFLIVFALVIGIAQAVATVWRQKQTVDSGNTVSPNRKEKIDEPDSNNFKQPGNSFANSGDKKDVPQGVETEKTIGVSAEGNLKPEDGNSTTDGERPTGDVIVDAEKVVKE